MLQIVIKWRYYKENVYFSSRNARQKKECVYFYDYDDLIDYILHHMDYSDFQRLRLSIYQKFQKKVKFTRFVESDNNGDTFEGRNLESPIIDVDYDTFAQLLPYNLRKKYFTFDKVRESYYLKSDFINYVRFHHV